jgi:hypothetical protein
MVRTEPSRSTEGFVERLRRSVARRVHPYATAEEDTDRLGSVRVDDGAEPRREVVEALVPCRRFETVADAHQRTFDAIGVVVHPRQCTPFGTGVPM